MSKGKHHRLLPRHPDVLSPQRCAARKHEALAEQQKSGITLDTNFLLHCSDATLADFELKRLAEVADLRSEMQVIIDRMIDTMSQAAVAAWFRQQDRHSLKRSGEDVVAWAKAEIRKREGRSKEREEMPSPSDFRPSLPPGAAHMAAALRYQSRNVAEGKCSECPEPLDPKSVRYCTTHLAIHRERMRVVRGVRKPMRSKATLAEVRKAKGKLAEENINLAIAEKLRSVFPEAAAALATPRKCRLCDEPVEPGERHCARHLAEAAAKGKGRKRGKT